MSGARLDNVEQRRAAEPTRSAWVAANAGSGKTRVLIDRVARLLLAGSDPARILCLTFTKAAAAEMQSRLFARLGAWAMLDDADLRAALRELGEPEAALTGTRLAGARTLFARALETPGGLKIQTIHAFCDALLRRFPLEAGVAPDFTVLEQRQARALRLEALEAVALEAPALLEGLARHLTGDDPEPVLAEIEAERGRFLGPLDEAALARALGHTPGLDVVTLARSVLSPAARALLGDVLPDLAAGSRSDRTCAEAVAAALNAEPDDALALLEGVFLYGKSGRSPFAAKRGTCPTKATRARLGPRAEQLDAFMESLAAARPRRLAIAAFDKACALQRFGRAWLAALERRKGPRLLDFDDLIERAVALLSDPAVAAFVLWRLDGGIDHVLVDEAQDTSPAQWRVIQAITEEFFAGEGARRTGSATPRTVFVVGDEKQSIYSFQGADPAAFAAMRGHFAARLAALEDALEACELLYSYRSGRPILDLVDAVFAGPAGRGLAGGVRHHPADPDRPGRVELWPFLKRPESPEEPPWDRPLDLRMPDDPVVQLAEAIAGEIRGWLDAGRPIPAPEGPRPVRAGDIMVLVQRRSTIFHPLIRALKRHRVPVAGADVLRIGGELAVKDLLAALRVAATPADDLALAAFLRSPLGGLSEAALFALAHGRPGTLLAALERSAHAEPLRLIHDLRGQADFLRPYELIERVLVRHRGRERLIARLGPEAEDGIDALLAQALAYEQVEPPTLTGFLAWITAGEVTLKRQIDERSDEVRVMTVHGAKGLQAPIVILPDTAKRQEPRPPTVLPVGELAAWTMRLEDCPPPLAAAERARRERLAAENRRLLYVALTRAESWLIVAGAGTPGKAAEGAWHACVAEALAGLGARREGERLVLEAGWPQQGPRAPAQAAPAAADLPAWAGRAPPVVHTVRPLAPSDLGGAHALPGEPAEGDLRARGERLHRLLDGLACWPRPARAARAAQILPGAPDLADLLAEAEGVLDAPELAPLFGAGARAEVAIAAPIGVAGGATLRILGRIDRLVVAPDRVLAADFKSNRQVPPGPEAVPEGILRQMGAYAAGLAALYPGRAIETAVVWTRGPRLMRLPPALTGAALGRALAAWAGRGIGEADAPRPG